VVKEALPVGGGGVAVPGAEPARLMGGAGGAVDVEAID